MSDGLMDVNISCIGILSKNVYTLYAHGVTLNNRFIIPHNKDLVTLVNIGEVHYSDVNDIISQFTDTELNLFLCNNNDKFIENHIKKKLGKTTNLNIKIFKAGSYMYDIQLNFIALFTNGYGGFFAGFKTSDTWKLQNKLSFNSQDYINLNSMFTYIVNNASSIYYPLIMYNDSKNINNNYVKLMTYLFSEDPYLYDFLIKRAISKGNVNNSLLEVFTINLSEFINSEIFPSGTTILSLCRVVKGKSNIVPIMKTIESFEYKKHNSIPCSEIECDSNLKCKISGCGDCINNKCQSCFDENDILIIPKDENILSDETVICINCEDLLEHYEKYNNLSNPYYPIGKIDYFYIKLCKSIEEKNLDSIKQDIIDRKFFALPKEFGMLNSMINSTIQNNNAIINIIKKITIVWIKYLNNFENGIISNLFTYLLKSITDGTNYEIYTNKEIDNLFNTPMIF